MALATNPDDGAGAPNPDAHLAYENVYLAHERTQLSWVQVSLALISFGFTIAKVVEVLHERDAVRSPHVSSAAVGVLMIAIGLIALTAATIQHRRAVRALHRRCAGLPKSQSAFLSVMLAVLGMVALVGVCLRQ